MTNLTLDETIEILRHDFEIDMYIRDIAPQIAGWLEQLKDFNDADEQGLLLKLPCKVGSKVYADSHCFGILEYEVDEIIIDGENTTFLCSAYSEPIGDCPSECLDEIEPCIDDFGKTVFLTREEAKQALEENKKDCSKCFWWL